VKLLLALLILGVVVVSVNHVLGRAA